MLRLVVPALLILSSAPLPRDAAAQAATQAAGRVSAPAAAADAPPFAVQVVGTGRPVLLIPGLTNGGAVWDGTVEALKRDHQLHVFTLAGFAGQAPIAADSTWLLHMRDAIVAYAGQQRLDRPVIVGHSLGGVLALWIAAAQPTLPGAVINVDGLPFLGATNNPAATLATVRPQAESMRRMMLGANLQGGNQATFVRMQEARLPSMIREGYGVTRERTDAMLAARYRALTTGTLRVHDSSYHFIMFDEPAWMLDEMRRFLAANR